MKIEFGYFPESEQPYEYEENKWEMITEPERYYVSIRAEEMCDHITIENIYQVCCGQGIYAVHTDRDLLVYFRSDKEKTWFSLMFA